MKIYIGNLSFDATEVQLRDTFAEFGEVTSVNVISDKFTGKPRGFAFVEMENSDEAATAIAELNGKDMMGRALNVNEAKPREAGGRGGGGGYRGGGGGGGGGYRGGGGGGGYHGGGGGGGYRGGDRGGDRW